MSETYEITLERGGVGFMSPNPFVPDSILGVIMEISGRTVEVVGYDRESDTLTVREYRMSWTQRWFVPRLYRARRATLGLWDAAYERAGAYVKRRAA